MYKRSAAQCAHSAGSIGLPKAHCPKDDTTAFQPASRIPLWQGPDRSRADRQSSTSEANLARGWRRGPYDKTLRLSSYRALCFATTPRCTIYSTMSILRVKETRAAPVYGDRGVVGYGRRALEYALCERDGVCADHAAFGEQGDQSGARTAGQAAALFAFGHARGAGVWACRIPVDHRQHHHRAPGFAAVRRHAGVGDRRHIGIQFLGEALVLTPMRPAERADSRDVRRTTSRGISLTSEVLKPSGVGRLRVVISPGFRRF
jgi:hypothetical protein